MTISNACTTNADCQDFYVCKGKSCLHKSLFPNVTLTESFVGLIFIVTTMLTTVAGAGSFYSPILNLIMSFTMETSAPVSITIGFVILFLRNFFVINYKNIYRRRPLINYDIILVFSPPILMGSVLGVMINTVSSTLLISVILILSIGTSIGLTWQRGIELRREAMNKNKHEFIDLTEEAEIYLERLKNKIFEIDEIYLQEEKNWVTTPEKKNSHKFYLGNEGTPKSHKSHSMASFSLLVIKNVVPEVELLEVRTDHSFSYCLPLENCEIRLNVLQMRRIVRNLESILRKESRVMDYEKALLVIINLCFVIILTLFRGTESVSSIIGVENCSIEFWILAFLYIPFGILFMMAIVTHLIQGKNIKLESGYVFHKNDLKWDLKTCVLIFLNGIGVGIVSSMIGLGGALLSAPLLFKLGMEIQEASFTASCLAMFSAASATIQYFIAGHIMWDYAIFYSIFSLIGMLFGLKGVLVYLKQENMTYVICFTLVFVSAMSLILSIFSNVEDLITNENSWFFRDFC